MLLPARHIRAMGCPGCIPERAQAPGQSGGTGGTWALSCFPGQTPFLLIFGQADSFPAYTPSRHIPPTASPEARPGPTRALAHGHGHPDPALEWNLRTSSSCLASAEIPPHWQIIKPRQTLSCMLEVLSFTLFIWNCMGRLAIRIASGSSHSKPQGDFAHNKTLYQNQFSLILIFFPYLGRKTQLSSPQNYPAAMRLAANLSRAGLPPTAIAVSPCVGSGCAAWLCSAQPLSEPTASQRCHAGSSILGDTAASSE